MRIYLNNSALNRPFDDQASPKIRVEAEAVLALLSAVEEGRVTLLSSEFLEVEVEQGPSGKRLDRLRDLLDLAVETVQFSSSIEARALELAPAGLRGFDAMHVASAEAGLAELLVSTDDRMVRRAGRVKPALRMRVLSPVDALLRIDQEKPR